jgi:hypothetical protein
MEMARVYRIELIFEILTAWCVKFVQKLHLISWASILGYDFIRIIELKIKREGAAKSKISAN